MLSYSKNASLSFAILVAIITTSFLSFFDGVPHIVIVINFFISFGAVFLLALIANKYFILKEIKKINKSLEHLKNDDLSFLPPSSYPHSNPFQKINQDLYAYATVKQQEIDDLKKLTAFRREFLADVSHELKTPIFAAQGFVLTLLDGAIKDKSVRKKFLKKAAKSLDALEMMVEDLLTISHMETGEIKMNFQNFDIIEVARDVLDQFEEKAIKKKIKMVISVEQSDTTMVYGDPRRILQVITNLISNAIKYSKPPDGRVDVNIKQLERDVIISVKDNGIGIPQKDIKRIFERFYRVEKSRSKNKGGAGLGLAIVKHILEGHNSNVTVNSTVGEGSVFSFKLKKASVEKS